MSGRHIKPTLRWPHAAELKTAGGAVAGAVIAGAIAASAAFTTPNTTPTAAMDAASQRTRADIAVLHADDRPVSRHEAHARHVSHAKRQKIRGDKAHSRSSEHRPAGAKSVSSKQILDLARKQVGIREDRAGTTKFNKWFTKDSRAKRTVKRDGGGLSAYRRASWCDMFVSWVGNELGASHTVGFDAYTVKHAEWFKEHGRWGHQPRPGAVTFFGWNGNKIDDIEHVGFTIKDNGDGTIKTVEGNTKNSVAIRKRDKSSVVGYGYPDYKK